MKRCWYILLLVAFASIFTCAGTAWAQSVVVSKVVKQDVTLERSFVGTVRPIRGSTVGSAVEGRVVEFMAREGDRVKKDQVLAKLRIETLEIQQAIASAELELQEAQLLELKAGFQQKEIDQAQARKLAAEAAMENTDAEYQRALQLVTTEAISRDALEDARTAADQAKQAYLEAKAYHDLVTDGTRPERVLQAAARVRAQQQQVRLIEDEIDRHTIRAPFDGYITAEHSEVGQWVDRGGPLVDVVQLDEIDVRIHVLASEANTLRLGASAVVRLGEDEGRELAGKVVSIVPQADEISRAVPVKIRVTNDFGEGGPLLKSNMLVRAKLPTQVRRDVILVPKDALVLSGGATYVFKLSRPTNGAQARRVSVKTGVTRGGMIEVGGALTPGDLVVVEGNERLRDRQTVTIESIRTPDEPAATGG